MIAAVVLGCTSHGSSRFGRSAGECATGGVRAAPTASLLAQSEIRHVVLVSVDGLGARFLPRLLRAERVPAFARLARDGASTRNARTDPTNTYTLPNHVSMLTGLPVMAPPCASPEHAHGFTSNDAPSAGESIHESGSRARSYTPSVFDMVHDHGLTTAMFVTKSKFSILTNSYNDRGAADEVGANNGKRKIDRVHVRDDLTELTKALIVTLAQAPPSFSFVHFGQPDVAGHDEGWGSAEYLDAIVKVDTALGRILTSIENEPRLAGHAAVIVTADHGGSGRRHSDPANPDHFVIPFYVLGPGVPAGSDLYSIAGERRTPPKLAVNPGFEDPQQPIRNGDAGNLALALLGLPPIPGSWMGSVVLPAGADTIDAARPSAQRDFQRVRDSSSFGACNNLRERFW